MEFVTIIIGFSSRNPVEKTKAQVAGRLYQISDVSGVIASAHLG